MIGQEKYRHKTRKVPFQIVYFVIAAMNAFIVAYLAGVVPDFL